MWLRGQLSKHSDEWEEVMKDHNEDIQQLREQLSAKAKAFAAQAQSTQEITQLAQQNQRLSAELDKVRLAIHSILLVIGQISCEVANSKATLQ